MPLDPLTAIGLAANILQFAEFTWGLVSEAREIHHSSSGASSDHDVLEKTTAHLHLVTSKIKDVPATVGPDLRDIAFSCQDISDRILHALNKIRAQGSKSRWKSFLLALKATLADRELGILVDRLERVQKQLMVGMLFMLGQVLISPCISNGLT